MDFYANTILIEQRISKIRLKTIHDSRLHV